MSKSILIQMSLADLKRAVAIREQIDLLQSTLDTIGTVEPITLELQPTPKVRGPYKKKQAADAGVEAGAPVKKLRWMQTAAGRAKLRRSMKRSWRNGAMAQAHA